MVRAGAAILAVTIAGLVCGACGTSSSTPGRSSTTDEQPPATPARALLTKSQAVAFANAVNIRPTDVPGFGVATSEQRQSAAEQRLEHALLGCMGILTGHDELAEVGSKEFELTSATGDFGVSSSVAVARTAAIAAKGLTARPSPHARSCLARYLSLEVEHNPRGGSSIRRLSASPEKALAPGTNGGVVLRILANVTLGGKPVSLALDFYGFVCGQAQIGLFTTSLPGAFPAKARKELLSLLRARAKARVQCAAAHPAGASAAFVR